MSTGARPVVAGLRLVWRDFGAPPGGGTAGPEDARSFGLWVPEEGLDELVASLTQEEFARSDERLPYFGAIWPAAEVLVASVLAGPALDGKRVLDLGCGLGACGFAAARRGARVTFFDWEPRALAIVAASAQAQAVPADRFAYLVGDWRDPPPCGPFDLILGADVLYEARNGPGVATFIADHLAPAGEAWLADPGRPHAQAFPALVEAVGLAVTEVARPEEAGGADGMAVFRVRWGEDG